jgi:hypothetical protein
LRKSRARPKGKLAGTKILRSRCSQKEVDDGGQAGAFDAQAPQFFQALAVRNDAAMGELLFGPVQFQIVDHRMAQAVHAVENERAGSEQPHRVKHVRIVLAFGHD